MHSLEEGAHASAFPAGKASAKLFSSPSHQSSWKLQEAGIFKIFTLLLLRFQLTNALKNGSLDLDAHINTHIAESNKP